ncbi:putative hydrolase, alpha/beta fold LipV [Kitasatospora phosalacinea]|uniref:Hydrolase, alpha/beta fold LipV n=1 Tax=Kitasatospora phosalacinea TaxID=2065 RepID=A0A9W6QGI5_9ACTN|nr:alpha/beta hydrolase [Kitasatospora phosalacinea]GLW74067.1 putative hydrolase, alpha/beta fold LipV [Kitasatospora phosalacinea]
MSAALLHARPLDPGGPVRTARPLLALHGVRGHGGRWGFLTGRTGYAVDLRGHGRSVHRPPWTLDQHAADVAATAARLAPDGFDLVGLSFGGAVALQVAARLPHLVHRQVLLDPAVAVDPARARELARAALDAPVFADPAEARAVRARTWPQAPDRVVDEEVRTHLAASADGRWRWRYHPGAVAAAFTEAARPLPDPLPAVPTLVVAAARGSLLTAATLRAVRAHGYRVAEVDAGHGMDIEAPGVVDGLVAQFLERPTGRPTP